jgi:xanthosine utilization system XapX-like protein
VITGVATIVNVCVFDVPPPGVGFTTLIEAVPAVAIKEACTVAVSWVDETKVVASAVPFHFTVEVETKFVPFTVKVNCEPPAVAQVGLVEVVVGTGLLIVKVCGLDVPPPGLGLETVTHAVPADAISTAGTVTVSCVEETNVTGVMLVLPPLQPACQATVEDIVKFVPFRVKVNGPDPAIALFGLIEVSVGATASTLLATANTRRNGRIFFIGRS